ncbi:MAG: LysR substrate-binding domain-containing protein, partial [Paracoccaceae bacterium]
LFLIEADLAAGRLIAVYGDPMPSQGDYHLVWPEDRPARPPLTAFRNWIKDQLSISAAASSPDR